MKVITLLLLLALIYMPQVNFAQAPNLGSAASFVLFTRGGALGNTGISYLKGNIGTNVGAISNFNPLTIEGNIYSANAITTQCGADLVVAYNQLFNTAATSTSHTPAFGSGEVLYKGVYAIAAAASVAGTLNLDAQGDSNAVFIFKIGGAFTTGAPTTINLVNGALARNVFWIAEGAIAMAAFTSMKGTLIANNGAISLGDSGRLEGRMFSTAGAVSVYNANASLPTDYSVENTWTGSINTNWYLTGNWLNNLIPTLTNNVVIPSGLTNYPILDSGTGSLKSITIKPGGLITVALAKLQIADSINNNGTFTATTGTVELIGKLPQTIPAGMFAANTIQNLIISNNVTLAGSVYVSGAVSFGNVNDKVFTTDSFLTIGSSVISTARLADITNAGINNGNSISGVVTVEKYIPAKRAFRFLSAPVNTTTSIRANWMENSHNLSTSVNYDPIPNYGTHITGNAGEANEFDASQTNNPSAFTFDNQTQHWLPLPNTANPLTAGNAYRILVRGSRSTDLNNNTATPTPTTLRSLGTLVTDTVVMKKPGEGGTIGMPELSSDTTGYSLIGNPYASPVDWLSITRTHIRSSIYIFDPTINGSNGSGAYVSYNGTLDKNSNASSFVDNHIQSWQSFFVLSSGPNPSLTFNETDKSDLNRPVFRTTESTPHLTVQLLLPKQVAEGGAADGFVTFFDDTFSAFIGEEDLYKFMNEDENIGINRDGKVLSIEGRKTITQNDTLSIKMWQMRQSAYSFKIGSYNFSPVISCYLEDAYLKTTTPIHSGNTLFSFSFTSDSGSFASDRFKIIFKNSTILPVQFSGIKGYRKNNGAEVEWTVFEQSNICYYEIERATEYMRFAAVGKVEVINNSTNSTKYKWHDYTPNNGNNFYRIKAIDKAGATKYTEVVKVGFGGTKSSITISPNPVKGNVINIQFFKVDKGEYKIKLLSATGQQIYSGKVILEGGSSNTVVKIIAPVAKGIYTLSASNGSVNHSTSVILE